MAAFEVTTEGSNEEDENHHGSDKVWLRFHSNLLQRLDTTSNITLLFSRAERATHNLNARKMLENDAIEASRCNSLLGATASPTRHY